LRVICIDRRRRQADDQYRGCEDTPRVAGQVREGPREEDRNRHEQELAGPEANPGCLRDPDEVQQEQPDCDTSGADRDGAPLELRTRSQHAWQGWHQDGTQREQQREHRAVPRESGESDIQCGTGAVHDAARGSPGDGRHDEDGGE
jgi:hypothetical protein